MPISTVYYIVCFGWKLYFVAINNLNIVLLSYVLSVCRAP